MVIIENHCLKGRKMEKTSDEFIAKVNSAKSQAEKIIKNYELFFDNDQEKKKAIESLAFIINDDNSKNDAAYMVIGMHEDGIRVEPFTIICNYNDARMYLKLSINNALPFNTVKVSTIKVIYVKE